MTSLAKALVVIACVLGYTVLELQGLTGSGWLIFIALIALCV